MNIRVVIPSELNSMSEKLNTVIPGAIVQSQAVIELGAKTNVPVVTANLQRSIGSSEITGLGGTWVGNVGVRLSQAKYGGWVESGSGENNGRSAWTITPKNGKMLAFKQPPGWNGPVAKDGRALARKVTIKGQKGQKYLARSAEDNRARIEQIFRSAIGGVINP